MKLQAGVLLLLVFAIAFLPSGCSNQDKGQPSQDSANLRPAPAHGSTEMPAQATAGGLKFSAPQGWIAEKPTSSMRQAQYRLPKADNDAEDAELVVFYFQGGGGGVQANIDRWVSQFEKPDGTPVSDAKTSKKVVNGTPMTIVDVSGTYMAGMGTMSDSKPKNGYRMLAVVVETGSGPWFFRLAGPAKTVTQWESSYQAFLETIRQ
jgi:hypothetical protein